MAKVKKDSGKKKLHHHITHHLSKEIKLTVGLLILVLLFTVPKFEYEAKETQTKIEEYEVDVVETDYNSPKEVRVCTPVPGKVREEPDPFSPFVKTSGTDFICYAKIRVWNDGDQEGEWTYRYTFQLGTKTIVKEETIKIQPAPSSEWFEFEADDCQEGDTLTGFYELVSGPIIQKCTYETQYPKITVTETKQRDVQEEIFITKREPLWQKLIGYNNHEKV